jgi:hypothetical protein
VHYDDERLLALRFCDLDLTLEGTWIEERLGRLHRELAARGVQHQPHAWLSTEWFSPDGVPGIALPFYLAHPRLAALERRQMGDVEGGTRDQCMRFLRHEAGHAVDTAYRLRRRRSWRLAFGRASTPYPHFYRPRPRSRRFVQHLDGWYAQSHPVEDFAETFAVWLTPATRWRAEYASWPALAKLEYLDDLFAELRGLPPPVRSRERVEPLVSLSETLGDHYRWKRDHYGVDLPEAGDAALRAAFLDPGGGPLGSPRPVPAATFLRRNRSRLLARVMRSTGQSAYLVGQILREITQRAARLGLRLGRGERAAREEATALLTVRVMSFLNGSGRDLVL